MEFWGTPPKTLSFTKNMKERGLKRRESVKAASKVLKDPCWNDSWENWINLTELDCRSLVKWARRTLQLFTMWEGAQAPTGGALKMPEDSCSYVIPWYHFWWTPRGFLWEHATLKHPETRALGKSCHCSLDALSPPCVILGHSLRNYVGPASSRSHATLHSWRRPLANAKERE